MVFLCRSHEIHLPCGTDQYFLDDRGFITYAAHGMPAYGDILQNEHSPVIRGGADVGVCYTYGNKCQRFPRSLVGDYSTYGLC